MIRREAQAESHLIVGRRCLLEYVHRQHYGWLLWSRKKSYHRAPWPASMARPRNIKESCLCARVGVAVLVCASSHTGA